MIFHSKHLRVTAEYGTATLWLAFPGEPANALDNDRLRELDAAVAAVGANPHVRVLVVRGGTPAGFCGGVHPDALASLRTGPDAAAFAWHGQRVLNRLAELDAVTVAFVEGPCVGGGLELALACDHRLGLAAVDNLIGCPDAPAGVGPCLGGTPRLERLLGRRAARGLLVAGHTLSAREAVAAGLFDHAFCDRRAKIELRTFLDRLERRPLKPGRKPVGEDDLAAERRAFAAGIMTPAARERLAARRASLRGPAATPLNPVPPSPGVVGFVGEDAAFAPLAAGWALRGVNVRATGSLTPIFEQIASVQARGFVTPLEAEQARNHVSAATGLNGFGDAGLVFAAAERIALEVVDVVRPRTVIAVCGDAERAADAAPFPHRVVGVHFSGENRVNLVPTVETDGDTLAAVAAWLKPLGVAVRTDGRPTRVVRPSTLEPAAA